MTDPLNAGARTSRADRWLRVFGDVQPGEGGRAALLLGNLFVLLVAYYLLKTVREPLVLASGGAELRSYAAAAQAALLLGLVPAYARLAGRADRARLIAVVTTGFLLSLEFLAGAVAFALPYVGVVFYIWVGIFSLVMIAQFWSFANDLYGPDSGERLFPVIAIGATAGSPVGAWVAGLLFRSGLSAAAILQVAAGLLVVHLLTYRMTERSPRQPRTGQERGALPGPNGFVLLLRNPYLLAMAALLLCLNLVNTTGEYIIGSLIVDAADAAARLDPGLDRGAFIGSFYGNYFFWVNIVAVAVQAFLVSRVVRQAGLAGAILVLPVVALGAYGLVALGAGFSVIRWAKTAENASDYSIMNTVRQLLWLPTDRQEKYKAKQAVDTFVVRLGDMIAAGAVFVGTTWAGLGVRGFAAINLVVIVGWLVVAIALARMYRRRCADCP